MDNKLDLFYRDLGMAFLHFCWQRFDVLQSLTGRETTGPGSARQGMLPIKNVPPDLNS